MDSLPQDPAILVSSINMLLRDGEFESLGSLCDHFDISEQSLLTRLSSAGYTYDELQHRFW